MIGLEGDGYRVLGLTVCGPAPLAPIHLDLRPGLSVLYGLNAAGKSRLLAALSAALQGYALEGGRGVIHVQLEETDAAPTTGFPGALRSAVRLGALLAGSVDAREEWESGEDLTVRELARRHLGDADDEVVDLVNIEAAYCGYFSLWATGRTEPSWQAWISDCIRSESPLEEVYLSAVPLVREGEDVLRFLTDNISDISDIDGEGFQRFTKICSEIKRSTPWTLREGPLDGLSLDSFFTRPPWTPVEIASVGTLTVGPLDVIRADENEPDLDGRTTRHVGFTAMSDDGSARVERLEAAANSLFRLLVGAGPVLRFLLRTPEDWFHGQRPTWVCDEGYESTVPIPQLSNGWRRWAAAAVRLALIEEGTGDVPSIVLADEPEGGLHRTAEAQMVAGFIHLTAGAQRAGIIATHSPQFLREPTVRRLLVKRAFSGLTEIYEPEGLPQADDLGLTEADLLALRRIFVIVEGEHDKIVLESIFGSELEQAFAEILVMRGAKNAIAVAHADWLLKASEAPLLIVLDSLGENSVREAWAEADSHARVGRLDDALESFKAIKNVPKDEAGFLARLGESAIRKGILHRLHFFGLKREDILLYLDDGPRRVKAKKQGNLSLSEVRVAARALDRIDPDLTDLMDTVQRLAAPVGRTGRT